MTEFSTEQISPNEGTDEQVKEEQVQNIEKEEQVTEEQNIEKEEQVTEEQNIEAQLEAEGLGVLDGENMIPEGEQTPLYMGTPASGGDSEGIDVPEQIAEDTEDSAEGIDSLPASCPVLTAEDREILATIRDLGGAATLSEIASFRLHSGASEAAMDRITGGDSPEYGHANYCGHGARTVIALAGATEAEVEKAANRAEAERVGGAFELSVDEAAFAAGDAVLKLRKLGGSSSLDGVKRHLRAMHNTPECGQAVLKELHAEGVIRMSVKGAAPAEGRDTRARYLTMADAPEGSLANAARRHAADETEIPARRAAAAERARKSGQGKAFPAPMVPFGGTTVTPEEQARALYIERATARYTDADLKGVEKVSMKLAASGTTKNLPAEEVTLYTAQENGAREFFTSRVKGRILTGLRRYEVLTGARILQVLFPEKGAEIVRLLAEGRGVDGLSPALAEPYTLFTNAVNELVSEGRVERTRKGLALAPEQAAEKASAAKAAKASSGEDWADRAPEPERQSGPDAHGADKYAADMAGAHDHRTIASGPQAPSTRPAQRRRTAKAIRAAEQKARKNSANNNTGNREASDPEVSSLRNLKKAECRQAWNQALEQYKAELYPQDRLELHLQLEGEQRLERMLEEAEEPDELYRAMITLKDEDRIQISTRGGYTIIARVRDLDREHLASELVEGMVRNEIPVPAGTTLAARVENTRDQLVAVS